MRLLKYVELSLRAGDYGRKRKRKKKTYSTRQEPSGGADHECGEGVVIGESIVKDCEFVERDMLSCWCHVAIICSTRRSGESFVYIFFVIEILLVYIKK